MFCLVIICDISKFVWVLPIKSKDSVIEILRDLITGLRSSDGITKCDKVVRSIRCDNEPVLRSIEFGKMLSSLGVQETHSVPYAPSQNGVVERFMRTLSENLRANMRGVDIRLWDHCSRYIAFCYNRIPKEKYARAEQFNGLAPIDAKNTRKGDFIPSKPETNFDDTYEEFMEKTSSPKITN